MSGRVCGAAYGKANEISPDAGAFINQGVAYQRLGDNARAVEAYAAGIKLNPNVPEAHLCLPALLQPPSSSLVGKIVRGRQWMAAARRRAAANPCPHITGQQRCVLGWSRP